MTQVPGEVVDLPTAQGPARAFVLSTRAARGALLLGHGAGAGVDRPDLLAVADAAHAAGWAVALVEQPWRVAGRRLAVAPPRLDEAWCEIVPALRSGALGRGPLVVGGRSAGARVACRTAARLGAAGVVCLGFPLHPPGRPDRSRAAELDAGVPVLVVQGRRDAFGTPEEVLAQAPTGTDVAAVEGDHSLRKDTAAVAEATLRWLAAHVVE